MKYFCPSTQLLSYHINSKVFFYLRVKIFEQVVRMDCTFQGRFLDVLKWFYAVLLTFQTSIEARVENLYYSSLLFLIGIELAYFY